MVLADLDTNAKESAPTPSVEAVPYAKAIYRPLPNRMRDQLERRAPDFTVKFTEDKKGFYINDRKFAPDDEPMTRVKVGTYAHWRVTNATNEIHPFHIHQVHFLVYESTRQFALSFPPARNSGGGGRSRLVCLPKNSHASLSVVLRVSPSLN
jgi:FtsP/CotA-like multicopper oxidase with cupredoxin domain